MSNEDPPVTVEVLHNKNCHVWGKSFEVARDVLDGKGIHYDIGDKLIETKEEARREGFSGSPQVKINGQDVDPDVGEITNHNLQGCRLYLYEGEVYEYPPEGMILDFLETTGRKNE